MFVLILIGLASLAFGAGSVLMHKEKSHTLGIACTVACLLFAGAAVAIYAQHGRIKEWTGVVAESSRTSDDGKASVNVLSLPGGSRYVDITCSESISEQQCASLAIGTIVTVRTTMDEYGVSSSSEIMRVNP